MRKLNGEIKRPEPKANFSQGKQFLRAKLLLFVGLFLIWLPALSADQRARHLDRYRTVAPDWKFRFDVADGLLPVSEYIKYHYGKNNMLIVDGDSGVKALQLRHLAEHPRYQRITINKPAFTQKGSGVLLAEWKMKYQKGVEEMGGFMVVFKLINAQGQGLLCYFRFYSDKIVAPWGTIELEESIKNRWKTFRTAIDVKKNVAVLWLNGKKIGEGKGQVRPQMAPEIFFGDGSGAVAGKAVVEYLNITTF